MPPAGPDPFNHALHTANNWLADIGTAFGTRDRRYTHRTLRAWLHGLRDRLTIDAAAKFGAQLPELLRGIYYEGWKPNKVPVKYGVDQYIQRFAEEAGVPTVQVPTTAGTITEVFANHMSPGQLEETFSELPTDLRNAISGGGSVTQRASAAAAASTHIQSQPRLQDRVARLEEQVNNLTEAARTLAHGLEDARLTGIDTTNVARAARLADEILLASSMQPAQ